MKKLKVSLLALSVLAGGLFAASAAETLDGDTFALQIKFGGTNFGLNARIIYDCYDLPRLTNAVIKDIRAVDTDGSGKIEGVAVIRVPLDNTTDTTNYVDLVVSVTGKMGNKGTDSTVSLSLKGNGRSQKAGVHGTANASLKWDGTVASVTPGGAVTNTWFETTITNQTSGATTNILGGPLANGSTIVVTNGQAGFGTNFVGTNFVTATTTNTDTYFNDATRVATGNYNGTINTGLKDKDSKQIKVKDLEAKLADGDFNTITGTNVTSVGGGLSVESLDIRAAVVRSGKKVNAAGDGPFLFSASGTQDSAKFSVNAKGVGSGRGSSLKLTGTPSSATNAFIIVGTNPPVPVTILIPGNVTASGKAIGQKVPNTTGTGSIWHLQ